MLSGHCECGRIRYQVDTGIKDFSHCHCSQCRRLHGAAYATFVGVARDDFRYLSGESDISVYASSERNDRVFCSNCGSAILCAPKDEPDALYLSMSTVEGNPPRPAAYHAYVGSKAEWHEITDVLEQFDTLPPD